jgi:hypothetical protein
MYRFFLTYFLYILRWETSTPILAWCIGYFQQYSPFVRTILANLIGALIFFWIDRIIFTSKTLNPVWETKENVTCIDCGKLVIRGYRLVKYKKYDKTKDKEPKWRCESCSMKKYQQDILNNKF